MIYGMYLELEIIPVKWFPPFLRGAGGASEKRKGTTTHTWAESMNIKQSISSPTKSFSSTP